MKNCLRPAVAAVGLFLSVAPSVFAQEEPDVDCDKAEVQSDLNFCADKDYQTADAALNATYKEALAATQKTDKDLASLDQNYVGAVDALKKAQRAWIAYRDGQCELAGFSARGGSMEPMLVSGCLADLTGKRTEELKTVIEDLGN